MDLKTLYCLNDARGNFTTKDGQDDDKIFGEKTLKVLLERMLSEAQVAEKPPRAMILGQNGLGKTKHLRYLEAKVKQDNLPFHVTRFKVGSYESKSKFNVLHNRMLTAFGLTLFTDKIRRQIRSDMNWFDAVRLPENVRHAFHQMATSSNPVQIDLAVQFLRGEVLKASLPGKLGVSLPSLEEGDDYASVLQVLADVVKLQDNKMLLFCMDELEYVQYVNNQDAYVNWRDGLRNLLDVKQAGFIFTIAAQSMDQIAKVMREPDIVRRIATNNYHKLPAYKPSDTQQFFRELLACFVDQTKLAQLETAKNLTQIPGYSRATFPFTEDALEGYCRWIHKKDSEAKPSEFEFRLDETASAACLQGIQIIDTPFLKGRNEYRDEE